MTYIFVCFNLIFDALMDNSCFDTLPIKAIDFLRFFQITDDATYSAIKRL